MPDEIPRKALPPLAQFGGAGAAPATQPGTPVACKPEVSPSRDLSAEVAKVIPQIIEPQSWKEAGGKGVIQALPGRLVILQTGRVHAQVARFLDELQESR